MLGNHTVGDDQFGVGPDVTVLGINFHPQLPGGSDRLFRGGKQGLLYSRDQDISADALLPLPKLKNR